MTEKQKTKEENLAIVREQFARIADRIEATWGAQTCEDYLVKLIVSDRERREGFPVQIFMAILRLHNMHKIVNQ